MKPILAVRPQGGLGNRLRVITSFELLARYSGRKFKLCWGPGEGWSDEDLNVLFENRFDEITREEFDAATSDGIALHRVLSIHYGDGKKRRTWAEGHDFYQIFEPTRFPRVTFEGGVACQILCKPKLRKVYLPRLEPDYEREIRKWRPEKSLRTKIDRVAADFGPYCVGVHVRRGDALHSLSAEQVRQSSDKAFSQAMDAELQDCPDARFFLATDCEQIQQKFLGRYGDALLVNREKIFVPSAPNRAKQNQSDAVIDLFGLARTHKLLGNQSSSFTDMAAALGGMPVERVREA